MKLQLVFKSQFCNVHGMSRIEDEVTVKSELLQLVIAGLNAMAFPPRFVKSCSTTAVAVVADTRLLWFA